MKFGRFIYILVMVFVLITLVMVFMQYNSSRHINGLITGNEKLLSEFNTDRDLRDIRSRMLSMENHMQEMLTTGDTSKLQLMREEIRHIGLTLERLNLIADDDSTEELVDRLESLLQRKVELNIGLVNSMFTSQESRLGQREALFASKVLTDSVSQTLREIESTRQSHLEEIITRLDDNGRKASLSGYIFLTFVLLVTVLTFLFIINKIKQQQELIRDLHLSQERERVAATVKENFLANMSHEIRTPMNAIVGFTSLLKKRELDPKAKEYAQAIHQSGENLLSIINDILDLSKIEAGMLRIEKTPFSLRDTVRSIENLFREKAVEKQLAVSYTVEDTVPDQLLGDPYRLTQILVNLIGNAIKFTRNGKVVVQFAGKPTHEGWNLEGFVEDTGIGIPGKLLPEIFDRFRQAEDSSTRKYGGTGLGLAIVKQLLDLQDGHIEVRSEEGKGTRFSFNIPYALAATRSVPQQEQLINVDRTGRDLQQVLVVEDNEINQLLIQNFLEEWKIKFQIASNGKEALQKLRKEHFDLVLMDIQMPEMDGYETSRKIRKELQLNIPILAMTAHAMSGEREKCLEQGMNDYLPKPVREQELAALLDQYLSPIPAVITSNPADQRNGSDSGYKTIDLRYMKEVSRGNLEYETLVTEEFLELCPQQLHKLIDSFQAGNHTLMSTTAHELKTTTSVMGLTDRLEVDLDTIENVNTSPLELSAAIERVDALCRAALVEARALSNRLKSQGS